METTNATTASAKLPRVEHIRFSNGDGRFAGAGTRVFLADGRVETFIGRMPKRQALAQATEAK